MENSSPITEDPFLNTSFPQEPEREDLWLLIPITLIYGAIFLTGIIGNICTCVVVAKNKYMHTATNYYLLSLAVSDLLLLVSGLPQEMYYIWCPYPYIFGEAFCVFSGFAAETSANATVLTITAFTVERYLAICHPFQAQAMSKLSRAVKFVIAIWIVALGLAVPQAIQFGIVQLMEDRPDTVQCTIKWVLIEHAFHISTAVFFVLPMTIITVLYVLIGLRLRKSRLLPSAKRASIGPGGTLDRNASSANTQSYVIKMLVAVVVAFFICWAPFHTQRLLAVYATNKNGLKNNPTFQTVYSVFTYLSGILYYLSTTINPLLYNIMSHKFREAFKSTLAQCCNWNAKRRRTYSIVAPHLLPPLLRPPTLPMMPSGHRPVFNRQSSNDSAKRPRSDTIETIFNYRPRGASNSSQNTLVTTMGRSSLGEGNNNFQAEHIPLTISSDNGKKINGHCRQDSSLGLIHETELRPLREGSVPKIVQKQVIIPNRQTADLCSRSPTAITSIAKKLRGLPSSTRIMFSPQKTMPMEQTKKHGLTSQPSVDNSTISNSSLQDLDDMEFVGTELAYYMGQLNEHGLTRT